MVHHDKIDTPIEGVIEALEAIVGHVKEVLDIRIININGIQMLLRQI